MTKRWDARYKRAMRYGVVIDIWPIPVILPDGTEDGDYEVLIADKAYDNEPAVLLESEEEWERKRVMYNFRVLLPPQRGHKPEFRPYEAAEKPDE